MLRLTGLYYGQADLAKMTMNPAIPVFVSECNERLDSLEALLLSLEQGKSSRELLDAMFRNIHTVKGNAAVIQNGGIEWFSHVIEGILDRLREGEIKPDSRLVSCLLPCVDHLRFLVGLVALPDSVEPGFVDEERARLIGLLVPYLDTPPPGLEKDQGVLPNEFWRILVHFEPNVLKKGLDPVYFLRHLDSIGKIVSLQTLLDGLPQLNNYQPECCYLGFRIELDTVADKQAIEDVFAFVSDDCVLRINPPPERLHDFISLIRSLPEEYLHVGEMLVRVGALTAEELARALRCQRRQEGQGDHECEIGDLLVEEGIVPIELVQAALQRQYEIRQSQAQEHRLLRVSAERLGELMELMALVQHGLERLSREARAEGEGTIACQLPAMKAQLDKALEIGQIIQRLRLEEVFKRLYRLVRDTSQALGKQADLIVSGGDIEVPREIAEGLSEPLIHMVRNALDHGIESPETRLAEGKPSRGQVRIDAWEEADELVILVSDDGAGVDRDQILTTARERGYLKTSGPVDEETLFGLLFLPGFTTAKQVSRISGRGVGMDAVKTAIESLGGSIRIRSFPARGTRFELRLPGSAAPQPSVIQALRIRS